jgi:hypothetical protein
MKRLAVSLLALGACSTTPPPSLGDVDLTNAGLMLGIEVCHRNIVDGVQIAQAVSEAARGRKHERSTIYSVVTGISPPSWKLDGDVLVGANDRGGCEIYIASGNGPEARKLAVSTFLGMSSRKWARMQIIAAPPGEVRDAVCTVDRMPEGKSVSVVMTSRLDSNATDRRTFAATVLQADAASCRSRQIP